MAKKKARASRALASPASRKREMTGTNNQARKADIERLRTRIDSVNERVDLIMREVEARIGALEKVIWQAGPSDSPVPAPPKVKSAPAGPLTNS